MTSRFNLPVPFGWYAISLSTDLSKGDTRPLKFFGKDLALFRTETGEAKVVDAMCPHLGAHLGHDSHVVGDSITCAFHGWKFDGDGYCTEVPYAKQKPSKVDGKRCLTSYPTTEINSVIWAWFHPEGIAPLYALEAIEELNGGDWDQPTIYEWTVNAPIQETGENAVDTAHFAYVHTAESVPEAEVLIDGYTRETRLSTKVKGINEDGTRTDDHSGTVVLSSFNYGPGQTVQRIGGSFDVVMMGTITPITADSTLLRFIYAKQKNETEHHKTMQAAFQKVMIDQVEEDIPIWNNKFYNPNPILCDGDGPIAKYRKWFSQFYIE